MGTSAAAYEASLDGCNHTRARLEPCACKPCNRMHASLQPCWDWAGQPRPAARDRLRAAHAASQPRHAYAARDASSPGRSPMHADCYSVLRRHVALAREPGCQAELPPADGARRDASVAGSLRSTTCDMCMCMCRASRSAFVCVRAGWAGSAARVRQLLRLRRRRRPASSQGHAPVGGRGDGACRSNSACNPTYPSCNPMQ